MLTSKQEKCCGCHACEHICPVNAICLEPDIYGFLEPQIDFKTCISCGKCRDVCQFLNADIVHNNIISVYAALSKNELSLRSTTGGVFALIAKRIIVDGGIVCGAAFDLYDDCQKVKHIFVDDIEGLCKLQGSKYAYSYLGETYQICKDYLKKGKKLLFSGTPCQVMGLKRFLDIDYDNLFTLDIVCHGTPSGKMFSDYLQVLGKGGTIIDFCFRDKRIDLSHNMRYRIRNDAIEKEKKESGYCSSYYFYFLNGETYRNTCYDCDYGKSPQIRPGDVSLCDYWGFSSVHEELIKNNKEIIHKSVSGIMINTEKGEYLFDLIKNDLSVIKSDFEKLRKYNPVLNKPTTPGKERKTIMEIYANEGYSAVEDYFTKHRGKSYFFHKVFFRLPMRLRNTLRYILWGGYY